MPFEYEALVGHLYVVGGRSISATPPGLLVEVSPRKAARGREADTFFSLVLPSRDQVAPAKFYEQMADLSAERYFNSTGSVTSGLRSVFNTLNENLYEHNLEEHKHYEASILCAVLRGSDLYLGKVGSGVALFRHLSETQPFPADFSNDEALFGPPLGVQPVPDVKMAHYQVGTGTRLVLADAGLADLDWLKLTAALDAADIGAVLVALKDLIAGQITLLAAEFVPPEVPAPLPGKEGESTAEISRANPPKLSTTTREALQAASALVEAQERDKRKRRATPLPSGLEASARQGVGSAALGLAHAADTAKRGVDIFVPKPDAGKRVRALTPMAAGAAVVIPIIVVILVVALWVGGTDKSEFDLCVDEANKAAELARSIASSDVPGTINAWNAVITVVNRCAELRPNDTTMQALTVEGRGIIDKLLSVERRDMTPIAAFPNAGLTRIVLQGEDLYALDNRNDLVYRVTLGEDGLTTVPGSQQPIASMRRGAAVNEFTVSDIVDIGWAQEGDGLSQPNVLLALDRSGVLVECPPRFQLTCESQKLLMTENWVNPTAFTLWQGRLYVLDPGANQMWRYEPTGGAFSNAPTEYFTGEGRPDIRNAVDFGIDDKGSVYLMRADGSLSRYTSGQIVAFGFASFPEGQKITDAQAMFLNTNPIAQDMYIVNQGSRTIFQTTLAGTFIASFRAQDESLFASIADVTVDPTQQLVYVTSGNAILAFTRTR